MSGYVNFPGGGIHSRVTVEHVANEAQQLRVAYYPARTDVTGVGGVEFTVPEHVQVSAGDMTLKFTCEQWRVLIGAVEAVLPDEESVR
jgi:hypothetical protein